TLAPARRGAHYQYLIHCGAGRRYRLGGVLGHQGRRERFHRNTGAGCSQLRHQGDGGRARRLSHQLSYHRIADPTAAANRGLRGHPRLARPLPPAQRQPGR
nr:hypothetical protein [Tanacetum cinerariifolium]